MNFSGRIWNIKTIDGLFLACVSQFSALAKKFEKTLLIRRLEIKSKYSF
jgi:hypothetical protein